MTLQFPTPKKYTAKVVDAKMLNDITCNVAFEVIEPSIFESLPGQFISLAVGDGKFRSYSISSNTADTKHLALTVTVIHEGIGSTYLKSLKAGDEVMFIGPSGRFTLPETLSDELLFMVTGTGMAAIMPMLHNLAERGSNAEINVYFGLRTDHHVFYLSELEEFKKSLLNFNYYVCLSEPSSSWKGLRGRVTDHYKVEDADIVQAFVCGNPNMVNDVIAGLKGRGVSDDRVFYERFTVSLSK